MRYHLDFTFHDRKFQIPVPSRSMEDVSIALREFFKDVYFHPGQHFDDYDLKADFLLTLKNFPIGYNQSYSADFYGKFLIDQIARDTPNWIALYGIEEDKPTLLNRFHPAKALAGFNPFVDSEEIFLVKLSYIRSSFEDFLKHGHWYVGLYKDDPKLDKDLAFSRFSVDWPEPTLTDNGYTWTSEDGFPLKPILWFGCEIAIFGKFEFWIEPHWHLFENSYDTLDRWLSYDHISPDLNWDRCADLNLDPAFQQWLVNTHRQLAPDVSAVFARCPIDCRAVKEKHILKETLQRMVLEKQRSQAPEEIPPCWPYGD